MGNVRILRGRRDRAVLSSGLIALMAMGCGRDAHVEERPGPGAARAPVMIQDHGSCPDCSIVFREVATLTDSDAPAGFREDAAGHDCMVGRLGSGGFVVSGVIGGGNVLLFHSDGTFSIAIGQRGQGPGELSRDLRVLVGPGDSLFVMDDGQARMTLFDAGGTYHRSFPTPATYRSFLRMPTGVYVFHRTSSGPGDDLFYVTDPEGSVLQSFGQPILRGRDAALDTWITAASSGGGIWMTSIWNYQLQEVDLDGNGHRHLTNRVDWLPGGPPPLDELGLDNPPPPVIKHIWEDQEGGLLWVYGLVPSADWSPDLPLEPRNEWLNASFDMVVEVIDPEEASLLARERLADVFSQVCGSPLMYRVASGERLDTQMIITRPELIRGASIPVERP